MDAIFNLPESAPDAPASMEVIPLTLAISLLLSLTFIALFVREFSRPRRAGAERDSLLPLEPDAAPRAPFASGRVIVVDCSAADPAATKRRRHAHGHHHHGEGGCSRGVPGKPRCGDCQRREAGGSSVSA